MSFNQLPKDLKISLIFHSHPQYFPELQQKIRQVLSVLKFKPSDTSTDKGDSNERYRRVVLTAGSSFGSKAVTMLIGLISVPFTVHYLGAERYGLWMTISSTIAFLTFADLGFRNGLSVLAMFVGLFLSSLVKIKFS